ncbi:restriction endonuclease subunit S [Finegoldia magna]|uniref:restriction endonuclease subunit S n=1 Tax=Finegoldia magna TaxID=1260 RepID=UPI0023A9E35D|nr:restriction endonuclease subunit S [Finegoldia magna]MCC2717936.1 restriction endonuclease subunit S [Finegoldia magna]
MTRKMKDSGIEWIGEIPEDWEISKLKYGFDFQKGINSNTYTNEYIEKNRGEYPVYSGQTENNGVMGKINTYDYDIEECLFTTTVGAKVMDVRLLCGKFNLSQNCLIMISNGLFSINYIFYFLQSLFDFERFMIPQYMQPSLRISDLENYTITTPNFLKQKQISYFLDKKTKQIEDIRNKISIEIENLENYKKSVITEAVTKGLDKNVEMKDSGIEWIGEIPKHWEVVKGKYILNLLKRLVRDTDEVITCFRDGEVTLRSNRREDGFTFSDKEIGYQGINAGDLVVHGMDGFAGAIGISDSRGKGSPVLNVIDSSENKKYLMYYLRIMAYSDVFTALATGIRVRSVDLRWNKLANLYYPLPRNNEQNQIVDYIDKKTKLIDDYIAIKQKQLEILEEYKKSLIYEYVTGKKEVKDGEES